MKDDDKDEISQSEDEYDAKVERLWDRLNEVVDATLDEEGFDGGHAITAAMLFAEGALVAFGDAADVETFVEFVKREALEHIARRDRGEIDFSDVEDDGVRH